MAVLTILLLPIGSIVVPLFWGSCLESYKVIPKGTTMEPMGRDISCAKQVGELSRGA